MKRWPTKYNKIHMFFFCFLSFFLLNIWIYWMFLCNLFVNIARLADFPRNAFSYDVRILHKNPLNILSLLFNTAHNIHNGKHKRKYKTFAKRFDDDVGEKIFNEFHCTILLNFNHILLALVTNILLIYIICMCVCVCFYGLTCYVCPQTLTTFKFA